MVFNLSDFSRLIIIVLIVFVLGSIFVYLIPYIILAGAAVWITIKIFRLFNNKKEYKDDEVKVEVPDENMDEMKKEAIDVDYKEVNK